MSSIPLFTPWAFRPTRTAVEQVMPDGCRDLLVVVPHDGPSRWMFTPLDDRPRAAPVQAGTLLQGYRLRPGVVLDPRAWREALLDGLSPSQGVDAIPDLVRVDYDVVDALEALGAAASVAEVAARAGVSTRSLQRLLQAHGLPAPAFWRQLGRARHAARFMMSGHSLADVAAEAGYSDQAHLTRAMRRWFGTTPRRLRATPALLHVLAQPGLGNWTGEQISTR